MIGNITMQRSKVCHVINQCKLQTGFTIGAGRNGASDVQPAVYADSLKLCNVLHGAVVGYHLRDALRARTPPAEQASSDWHSCEA